MAGARVVSNPEVMMGKPVVEGTRVTVDLILEKIALGESMEQIVAAHPSLTRDGVLAAVKYAADILRSDVIHPVGV
jgi:uncharacterized protein (DUF433 family)